MKIKCPWYDEKDELGEKCFKYCRNEKELLNHIVNYPHHGIAKKFARQYFKIHEKIEEMHDKINERPQYSEDTFRFAWARNELKSLLD